MRKDGESGVVSLKSQLKTGGGDLVVALPRCQASGIIICPPMQEAVMMLHYVNGLALYPR